MKRINELNPNALAYRLAELSTLVRAYNDLKAEAQAIAAADTDRTHPGLHRALERIARLEGRSS